MDARWWLASFVMLTACLLTGCVERRFVITTTAPGLPPDKDLSYSDVRRAYLGGVAA